MRWLRTIVVGVALAGTVAGLDGSLLTEASGTAAARYEEFAAVSCPSSTACVAVGAYQTAGGSAELPLVERWNGSTWTRQSVPAPPGAANGGLLGVSCKSASACVAVGVYEVDSATTLPLTYVWNGTAWTRAAVTIPSGAKSVLLEGVSCTSATACVAVGNYISTAGKYGSIVYAWNGTTWTRNALTLPSGSTFSRLWGTSCPSAVSACAAVGEYAGGGQEPPLAYLRNRSAWTRSPVSAPAVASQSELDGVSCTSRTACVAVGHFISSPVTQPLTYVWNGSTWTEKDPPIPSDADDPRTGTELVELGGVSCTSATACIEVGLYINQQGVQVPLTYLWNGSTWTRKVANPPAAATSSSLSGVSCTSATACVAVGSYYSSPVAFHPLSFVWNGSTWARKPGAA